MADSWYDRLLQRKDEEKLKMEETKATEPSWVDKFRTMGPEPKVSSYPAVEAKPISTEQQSTEEIKTRLEKAEDPDAEYKRIFGMFNTTLKQEKPADFSEFKTRLDALDKEYQSSKDSLERQELAETIAQALTQFGAGMYGMKHGVDMSGLKFNKRDWDKKMDQSLNEFRVRQAAIERERSEAIGQEQDRQRAAERQQDVTFRAKQAAFDAARMKEQFKTQQEQLEETKKLAKSKEEIAKVSKAQQNLSRMQNSALSILLKGSNDEDTKLKLKTKLGLSDEVIDSALEESENFFGNKVDPTKAMEILNPAITEKVIPADLAPPESSGTTVTIEYTDDKGNIQVAGTFTPDKAKAAEDRIRQKFPKSTITRK